MILRLRHVLEALLGLVVILYPFRVAVKYDAPNINQPGQNNYWSGDALQYTKRLCLSNTLNLTVLSGSGKFEVHVAVLGNATVSLVSFPPSDYMKSDTTTVSTFSSGADAIGFLRKMSVDS